MDAAGYSTPYLDMARTVSEKKRYSAITLLLVPDDIMPARSSPAGESAKSDTRISLPRWIRVSDASLYTASFTDHSTAAASRGGLPPCCRIAASQGDRNFSATESCLSDTVSISIPTGNGAMHTAAYSGECDTER